MKSRLREVLFPLSPSEAIPGVPGAVLGYPVQDSSRDYKDAEGTGVSLEKGRLTDLGLFSWTNAD